MHTSTNSAAYFEGKQANVSAADAKKNTFLYGGVAKAEVRERTCQGRGLRHRSKACEVLTTEVRGLAMTNKAGSGCAASTLHRCSTAPARALRRWVPLWQCSNNFPVRVSAAEQRHLSVSRYCGLTIFPAFSGTLGPSSTDDSTIFQFFITVTILVFHWQP